MTKFFRWLSLKLICLNSKYDNIKEPYRFLVAIFLIALPAVILTSQENFYMKFFGMVLILLYIGIRSWHILLKSKE